jgi:hypothetical protein
MERDLRAHKPSQSPYHRDIMDSEGCAWDTIEAHNVLCADRGTAGLQILRSSTEITIGSAHDFRVGCRGRGGSCFCLCSACSLFLPCKPNNWHASMERKSRLAGFLAAFCFGCCLFGSRIKHIPQQHVPTSWPAWHPGWGSKSVQLDNRGTKLNSNGA